MDRRTNAPSMNKLWRQRIYLFNNLKSKAFRILCNAPYFTKDETATCSSCPWAIPQILWEVINVEVELLRSHVAIYSEPISFQPAWCYGNHGNAWSLFNKRGRTRARVPYWPLKRRLNAGDISEVEFAISTNMRASWSPAWQHIKSIQITWIPNTLIPVSGGMHYN